VALPTMRASGPATMAKSGMSLVTTTCRDNGATPDSHAFEHDCVEPDPDIVFDHDGRAADISEISIAAMQNFQEVFVPVACGEAVRNVVMDVHTMGDQYPIAYADRFASPDSCIRPDEHVIANMQLARVRVGVQMPPDNAVLSDDDGVPAARHISDGGRAKKARATRRRAIAAEIAIHIGFREAVEGTQDRRHFGLVGVRAQKELTAYV